MSKKKRKRRQGAPIIAQSPVVHTRGGDFVILPSGVATIPGRAEQQP